MARWRRLPPDLWDRLKERMIIRARHIWRGWKMYSTKPGSYPRPEENPYRRKVRKRYYRGGYREFKTFRGSYFPDLFLTGRLWSAVAAQYRETDRGFAVKFYVNKIRYPGTRRRWTTQDIAAFNAEKGRNIFDAVDGELATYAVAQLLEPAVRFNVRVRKARAKR